MKRAKHILMDTVPAELWQGISFYKDIERTDLMMKAIGASFARNFIIFLLLWIAGLRKVESTNIGLVLVGIGATLLAYVALRMRIHSLDFVSRDTERFSSSSRRQSYFDVLNVTDSLLGFFYIVSGFSVRILLSIR